jgi:hypothetical protein
MSRRDLAVVPARNDASLGNRQATVAKSLQSARLGKRIPRSVENRRPEDLHAIAAVHQRTDPDCTAPTSIANSTAVPRPLGRPAGNRAGFVIECSSPFDSRLLSNRYSGFSMLDFEKLPGWSGSGGSIFPTAVLPGWKSSILCPS